MPRNKKQDAEDEAPTPETERVRRTGVNMVYSRRQLAQQELAQVTDLAEMDTETLSDLAQRLSLSVEGTGANGRVLKSDLINALDPLRGGANAVSMVEATREPVEE